MTNQIKIPLHVGPSRTAQLRALTSRLENLPEIRAFNVTISDYQRDRSADQNRYLWGIVYARIIASMAIKPTPEAVHEYWLGEHYGWREEATHGQINELFGANGKQRNYYRQVPERRSSKLTTAEFSEHWQFIQRRCIDVGLYIPDPNEEFE